MKADQGLSELLRMVNMVSKWKELIILVTYDFSIKENDTTTFFLCILKSENKIYEKNIYR